MTCLVFLALVPAWTLMAYSVSVQRRTAADAILRRTLRIAEMAAQRDEQVLEGARQLLRSMGEYFRIACMNRDQCNRLMVELKDEFERYADLGAITPGGEVVCGAIPYPGPVSVASEAWFLQLTRKREFTVGDYQVDAVTGRPVLVAASPVFDAHGGLVVVAFAAIDLHWLNRMDTTDGLGLPPGGFLAVVDGNGIVLARDPDPDRWIGQPLGSDELLTALRAGSPRVIDLPDLEGTHYLYAVAPVENRATVMNGGIVLGIPTEEAFSDANRAMWRNLLLLGAVTLFIFSALWAGGHLLFHKRMTALAVASGRLAAGDLNARTGLRPSEDELGQLSRTFDEMAGALEKRIEDLQRAEAEISEAHQQLRRLAVHSLTVREEERTRIARQIHDELGQAFTALKIDLIWLRKHLDPGEAAAVAEKTDGMLEIIAVSMGTVHSVSAELRPGILDDLGLAEAIEWQVEEFQKRTGIACDVDVSGYGGELNRELSTTVFRILQEALTNTARHSGAGHVVVILASGDGGTTLTVTDDGRGIEQEEMNAPDAFGIMGIRERASSFGGSAEITGRKGHGTRITITFPSPAEQPDHV